ncbi:MAG TPA: hypothetical protein VFQ71_08965 [Gaiellales bacterium]|jgi:hypothetical protein|nr:hypothetical protein [Gaiellales bacterium]
MLGDIRDWMLGNKARSAALAVALIALIVVVAAESAKSSAPDQVNGTLESGMNLVSGSNVWCAWSNHLPPLSQQDSSSMEGSAEHVEMHIRLQNQESRPVSVSIVSRYYIGAQAYGDSSLEGHVRTIPAGATVNWYLNAGTPQRVPTDAPIARCVPVLRSVSAP